MPQVVYSEFAVRDLQRLREFLRSKNPIAAKRAGEIISKSLQRLSHHPEIGRPIEDMSENYREWLIDFGDSGYIARYRLDNNQVTILAIRHQKEAGYSSER